MKVRINATGDTIVMKFVRPNADTKLEGYILGYGSSVFSRQFIQLPEDGKPYEAEFGKRQLLTFYLRLQEKEDACQRKTDYHQFDFLSLDAEPKYLIAVQRVPTNEVKKQCTGNASSLTVQWE